MMMSPGGEYPLHEKFTLSRFSEIVNELKISAARRIMGKIDVKNMELYYSSFHALKNINLEIPVEEMTKSMASRQIDTIIAQYGK